ncbi:hypothetical protein NLG97_g9565 [Lecanicillium saksenae]|uniref:Uncharacterized protein n=1 Tax=Lecanicillium saksenae TaxID=468837 RepID=A0ACC1QHC4_9HYPO|nr:hypothetical protein NLG97_g9565 [Lecanicillium saksenae]
MFAGVVIFVVVVATEVVGKGVAERTGGSLIERGQEDDLETALLELERRKLSCGHFCRMSRRGAALGRGEEQQPRLMGDLRGAGPKQRATEVLRSSYGRTGIELDMSPKSQLASGGPERNESGSCRDLSARWFGGNGRASAAREKASRAGLWFESAVYVVDGEGPKETDVAAALLV